MYPSAKSLLIERRTTFSPLTLIAFVKSSECPEEVETEPLPTDKACDDETPK
jgi:hypothetical protein